MARDPHTALVAVKLLHTVIWAFFASCILALPVVAILDRFDWALALSGLVLIECAVLAFNRVRCPLTDVAARYTPAREPNFDIYLPMWLARYNKWIFGTLFIAGEAVAVYQWIVKS